MQQENKGERLAKLIARSGHCSRRDAEKLIEEGRVSYLRNKLELPAIFDGDISKVEIDGKAIAAKEETRLWLYHKPRSVMTTSRDPEGRPTIYDDLPKNMPRVISVGRLDFNSEGLLLLTNDGELARKLELPSNNYKRSYRIRIFGELQKEHTKQIESGIKIDGVQYKPIKVKIEKKGKSNSWIILELSEGKNREIRRIINYLGFSISRLIRVSYDQFSLGNLNQGEVKEVSNHMIRKLLVNG